MVDVTTRTLRDYLSSLPDGGTAGVVDQNLGIRNDVVTTANAIPNGGTTGQVLGKLSNTDLDFDWVSAGVGDMLIATYDPQGIGADAFDLSNMTDFLPAAQVSGLATVATSGAYADLTGKPALGSAAAAQSTDFATAAQGATADTAVQPTATQTLTNKRVTPRISTTTSTATLTPNSDSFDVVAVSAQAAGLTINQPSGTPTDGQRLILRLRDNGTPRAITWNAAYSGYDDDLPTATVISSTMIYEFMWNAATSKWDLFAGNPIPGKWG